jgi:hypothetical protein
VVKLTLQKGTLDSVWLEFYKNLSISHPIVHILYSKKIVATKVMDIYYKVIQVDIQMLEECMLNKCKINSCDFLWSFKLRFNTVGSGNVLLYLSGGCGFESASKVGTAKGSPGCSNFASQQRQRL